MESSFEAIVVAAWKEVRPYLLADLFWCQCLREVNRAWHTLGDETYHSRRIRHLVLAILQYDDAYRFRFQRMMEDMDPERFRTDPLGELSRIVALAEGREQAGRLRETWRMAKLFLRLARFHPIRRHIVAFFEQVDLEKMRLSEADRYWANLKTDIQW